MALNDEPLIGLFFTKKFHLFGDQGQPFEDVLIAMSPLFAYQFYCCKTRNHKFDKFIPNTKDHMVHEYTIANIHTYIHVQSSRVITIIFTTETRLPKEFLWERIFSYESLLYYNGIRTIPRHRRNAPFLHIFYSLKQQKKIIR